MVVTVILEHDHEVVTGTRKSGQGLNGNTRRKEQSSIEDGRVLYSGGSCRNVPGSNAAQGCTA